MIADRVRMRYISSALPPYDGYTVVMLHMDGENNSTTFTDETGKIWTPHGGAKISTSYYKFGAASGYFDGTGDYISTPDSDDFYFGSGDFTIDFWFNAHNTLTAYDRIFSQSVDANNRIFLAVNGGCDGFVFYVNDNGAHTCEFGCTLGVGTPLTVGPGAWYHIAIVRNGSNYYGFILGLNKTYSEVNLGAGSLPNISAIATIGATESGTGDIPAYIEEFRISKGIARWTSNFTVPAEPYS